MEGGKDRVNECRGLYEEAQRVVLEFVIEGGKDGSKGNERNGRELLRETNMGFFILVMKLEGGHEVLIESMDRGGAHTQDMTKLEVLVNPQHVKLNARARTREGSNRRAGNNLEVHPST